jgi:hypothetical protein
MHRSSKVTLIVAVIWTFSISAIQTAAAEQISSDWTWPLDGAIIIITL